MKYTWLIIGAVVLVGGLFAVVAVRPMPKTALVAMETLKANANDAEPSSIDVATESMSTQPVASEPAAVSTPATEPQPTLATGRYVTYDAGLVDDTGYNTTVLFFYAAWCPECRGYDQALDQTVIPDGVQILQVTYDDSQDLRQKYGVTIQSTFVRVDSRGDKQTLWNGYGKQKSLDAIIENTK
jgi:thiol-disulfide isomerase/thioredoxin